MKKSILLALLVLAGIPALYKWLYPYGHHSCLMPCVLMELERFSEEHDGWFPNEGLNPNHCLQALYPRLELELAGVSGNRQEVARRLKADIPLDESVSSWVYFPGLRFDDNPKLALIWEREEGVGFNGKRKSGHVVGFVNGRSMQIPREDWLEFVKAQGMMRKEVLDSRASGSGQE